MSQTLTPWAANSLTSGSIKPTNASTLSGNITAIANLDNRQVVALSVLGKIYELHAKGGTDYRTNHAQLRTDSTNFMGVFSNIEPARQGDLAARIQAVLDWNAGYQADSTIGTDVNSLVSNMGGLRETPETTLLWEYFFLLYQLAI